MEIIFSDKKYAPFAEIKTEMEQTVPAIVYKYRDWSNNLHRSLLSDNTAWFSHPDTLNDPHDVRPPYLFFPEEVKTQEFLQKMYDTAEWGGRFFANDRDKKVYCENYRDLYILPNPEQYLRNNYSSLVKGNQYDRIGVFSTATSGSEPAMWANYGANHTGFCVGLRSIDLIEDFACSCSHVTYSNEPIPYSFFDDEKRKEGDFLFYKAKQWEYELEYRFLTLGIGVTLPNGDSGVRAKRFRQSAVVEVVLGKDIIGQHEQEIINLVQKSYPGVPVYKASPSVAGFTFDKIRVV